MKVLVINCGSSSLRFQLLDIRRVEADEKLLVKGLIQRIGEGESSASCTTADGRSFNLEENVPDHKRAIEEVFNLLLKSGTLRSAAEIEGIGHRMVHGGEHFRESALIDAEVENAIEECCELAPLHNPHNLNGYRAARELLPEVPQVAVFDTAFHATLPERAYLYAIPYETYTKDKVRRFGFHGTSHRFVSERFAHIQNDPERSRKIITCHLGNGCSMSAVDGGESVDTSMGFTPIEGLVMGTRPGDVDPGVLMYLLNRYDSDVAKLDALLNKQSGLLGLSGSSNDMRDLIQKREGGDRRAGLAVEIFCYRVRKYIGSYMAALGGADAVIFTGGIGENAVEIRAEICEGLQSLGISLDPDKNRATLGVEAEISIPASPCKVWVIPTNEELLIARDTVRCIRKT
ncbi:MAG: acetate kinase [Acidobacteria bacterium]|nr:acetate kinase [Acidobacteriota bacterium]